MYQNCCNFVTVYNYVTKCIAVLTAAPSAPIRPPGAASAGDTYINIYIYIICTNARIAYMTGAGVGA